MGIAFSQLPIVDTLVDGSTSALLRSGLHTAVTAAGWVETAAVTNGKRYRLTSSQGLQCKCLIQDQGVIHGSGFGFINVQFMSEDETRLGVGMALFIAPRSYRVVAGHCQLFVSLPGYSDDTDNGGATPYYGQSLAGGIPYIAKDQLGIAMTGECGRLVDAELTTESWWSASATLADASTIGLGNLGFGNYPCFRWGFQTSVAWSACHNADVVNWAKVQPPSYVRLLPLAHVDFDRTLEVSLKPSIWRNGDPLYIDPFVAWGTSTRAPARLRGQLWDAMICTTDQPLDAALATVEDGQAASWRNYTHYKGSMAYGSPGSYHMSLYLLTGTPAGGDTESNYVY